MVSHIFSPYFTCRRHLLDCFFFYLIVIVPLIFFKNQVCGKSVHRLQKPVDVTNCYQGKILFLQLGKRFLLSLVSSWYTWRKVARRIKECFFCCSWNNKLGTSFIVSMAKRTRTFLEFLFILLFSSLCFSLLIRTKFRFTRRGMSTLSLSLSDAQLKIFFFFFSQRILCTLFSFEILSSLVRIVDVI